MQGDLASNPRKRKAQDQMEGQTSEKKSRVEQPSKVIHVRNLPPNCSEAELVSLFTPFGKVVKDLFLPSKNQAFIQMDSVNSASAAVQRYSANVPTLRNKQIYMSYSLHTEIQSSSQSSSASSSSSASTVSTAASSAAAAASSDEKFSSTATSILLVTVKNVLIPVTIDHLHQIFKNFGDVLKIVVFTRQNELKAFIQMATIEAASTAKGQLDGRDIFQDCCTLQIGFSNQDKDLTIKTNDPSRARDYTKGDTTPLNLGMSSNYLISGAPPVQGRGSFGFKQPGQGAQSLVASGGAGSVLLVNNVTTHVTPEMLFTLFGVYGDVMRVKILYNKRDSAMIQMGSAQEAMIAMKSLNKVPLDGKELVISTSKHSEISLPKDATVQQQNLTKDFFSSKLHRFRGKTATRLNPSGDPKRLNAPSRVLHVSNLPDTVTEDQLQQLFGKESKQQELVIHLFQPSSKDKDSSAKAKRKQAFIRMEDVGEAVMALIKLHNHKLAERYLRISFSSRDPAQVGTTTASTSSPSSSSSAAAASTAASSTSSSTQLHSQSS